MRDLVAVAGVQNPDKLVVHLWKNADGMIFARSVEVIDKVSRVRFSFNKDNPLKNVFSAQAASELIEIINKTISERGMLMLPDLRIDLNDLVLQGCRVMVTAVESGIEQIMVRFVKFYGRVTSLFKEGMVHRDSLSEEAVDRAVDALERIYLPLKNFSAYVSDLLSHPPEHLDRKQRDLLQRVNKEITDLNVYSNLISHYVNSQGALQQETAQQLQAASRDMAVSGASGIAHRPDDWPEDQD